MGGTFCKEYHIKQIEPDCGYGANIMVMFDQNTFSISHNNAKGCFTTRHQPQNHFKLNSSQSLYINKNISSKCIVADTNIPENVDWNDTIPFIVPITGGRVIKIYDGDTITIASKLCIPDCPLYRFQVRFAGIDCPEMKSTEESEKEIAIIARDKLCEKILGKWVELKKLDHEKYGRILADVWYKSDNGEMECINDWMIDSRLAVRYDGGTKHHPNNWKQYYLSSFQ